jgi:DNA-binding CsgD family transcriptional regulator
MTLAETDLSSLNDHERTVLGLLAQGHTVKSIATLTRRSEASVNERLREARRKTGVGSSRELARLLREQENRDEEIGVAMPGSRAASGGPEAARPAGGTNRKGPMLMFALLLGGAAALALTLTAPHRSAPVQDAALDAFFPDDHRGADARRLAGQVRSETRDPAWAPRAEAALQAWYRGIAHVGTPLTATCAATVCEVRGSIMPGVSEADRSATWRALQAEPGAAIGKAGLRDRAWFGIRTSETPGEPDRFILLWAR